jgi:hypothetical protein
VPLRIAQDVMTPDIIAKYDSEAEAEALMTEFSVVQAVTPYDTV